VNFKTKVCLGLALLITALVGGLYLSGFPLTLLGVDVAVSRRTWWPYWQAVTFPQFAPTLARSS
jgi:hypothetical protein